LHRDAPFQLQPRAILDSLGLRSAVTDRLAISFRVVLPVAASAATAA
jgi:hypothetical protein